METGRQAGVGRAGRVDVPRRPVPSITAVTKMHVRACTSVTGMLAMAQEMLCTRAREMRASQAPLD